MVDLIDRQAVQEMVDRIGDIHPYRQIGNRESYSQYNEAWTDAINRVDAELNSLPSADIDLSDFSDKLWAAAYERGKAEAVRWIPCKERLPENRLYVLVTYKYEYGLIDHGITWYGQVEGKWNTSREVIAWMPLPEPYKGGQDD